VGKGQVAGVRLGPQKAQATGHRPHRLHSRRSELRTIYEVPSGNNNNLYMHLQLSTPYNPSACVACTVYAAWSFSEATWRVHDVRWGGVGATTLNHCQLLLSRVDASESGMCTVHWLRVGTTSSVYERGNDGGGAGS
jgi:hypothetical protein